jgi:penicillin-binding protein 2
MMFLPQILSERMRPVLLCLFAALGTIVIYLFHLQISQSNLFSRLSKRNYLRTEEIASPRGNITDRNGALLVTNRPLYSLVWEGSGTIFSADELTALKQLLFLCKLDERILPDIQRAEKRSQKYKLVNDISYKQLSEVLEKAPYSKNLVIKETYERSYPHNDTACHIIGYLSAKDSLQGKMGLERLYEQDLQGHPGQKLKVTNAIGNALHAHMVSHALAGKTLQTTLDLTLQQIAEDVFPSAYEGSMIFMDEGGALEVVLSRPSFDPSIFLKPISHGQWNRLQEKKRFMNCAFSACYPPASLFKLVTLTAGLETGIITPQTPWHCKGYTDFKGRHYHCNNDTVHGHISTKQAFAQSCNQPFYEIGKRISIDMLAKYAQELGLGSKTGIVFPEQSGLVPTSQWKKRVKNEPWWPGETLSAAIGQSSLLVTPLQIACLLSALCTGYRVRPRILTDEPIIPEILSIRPSTLRYIQECLEGVIIQGTGSTLASLKGFKLKGKSGTAQVRSRHTDVIRRKDMPHGYFAAHVQYRNEKPRTLVIFIEHAGSSSNAIRVAYSFLTRYAEIIDKQSETTSR